MDDGHRQLIVKSEIYKTRTNIELNNFSSVLDILHVIQELVLKDGKND